MPALQRLNPAPQWRPKMWHETPPLLHFVADVPTCSFSETHWSPRNTHAGCFSRKRIYRQDYNFSKTAPLLASHPALGKSHSSSRSPALSLPRSCSQHNTDLMPTTKERLELEPQASLFITPFGHCPGEQFLQEESSCLLGWLCNPGTANVRQGLRRSGAGCTPALQAASQWGGLRTCATGHIAGGRLRANSANHFRQNPEF